MGHKCTGFLATTSGAVFMFTLLLWGPKTLSEEFKPDLWLQCTLEKGLPFLPKSLYLWFRVELKELRGMLLHLKYEFTLLYHWEVLSTSSTLFITYRIENKQAKTGGSSHRVIVYIWRRYCLTCKLMETMTAFFRNMPRFWKP